MTKWLGVAVLLVAGTLAYTLPGAAQRQGGSFSGALPTGRIEEIFDMAGGFKARGKVGDPRQFSDVREHRFIPFHYGSLAAVTTHGEWAVLWFRDNKGIIRNITLPDASRRSYYLELQSSVVRDVQR